MKQLFTRLFSGCVAIVFAFSFTSATVQAVAFDENFYSQNNIQFYSPQCEETASNDGAVQLAGNDNTEKILNFFMRKGLSLAQSSGIVGNMMQESGLNPAKEQGGRVVDDTYVLRDGVGFGLVQWTSGGRQQNFMKYMKSLGVGVTDLSGQLGFVWKEMNESYPHTLRALKASNNPVDAAVAMHGPPNPGYEASADTPDQVRTVRGGNAQKVYNKYKDAPALAGSTAGNEMMPAGDGTDISLMATSKPLEEDDTGECVGDTAVQGNGKIQPWALKYAWPDFKGSGFTEQKPEYKEAVARASKAGKYIGGSGGNDCGGFVTTLVHDSGFDKNYNAGNGYTVIQEQWLEKNWRRLSEAEEKDPSKRVEGDVAINANHTYIYVGKFPGFNSEIASASLPDRSPMAGQEGVVDPSFRWYRRK